MKLFLLTLLAVCLNAQTAIADFTPTVDAPSKLFAGTELTLMYRANVPNTAGTLWITSVAAPEGATSECFRGHDLRSPCSYKSTTKEWGIGESWAINAYRFNGLQLGKHTVTLTMRVQTVTRSVSHSFEVVALPDRKLIPELAVWQKTMLAGAPKFCTDVAGSGLTVEGTIAKTPVALFTSAMVNQRVLYIEGKRYLIVRFIDTKTVELAAAPPAGGDYRLMRHYGSFSYEGSEWFYDGGKVYLQIADWTGNKDWERCAYNILDQYADNIIKINAQTYIYRVFTDGLLEAWKRTGIEKYRQAIKVIAENAPLTAAAGSPEDGHARETAYIWRAMINYERAGYGRHPKLARTADHALHLIDALVTDRWREYHQPFWDGLLFSSARDHFYLTGDKRVLFAIKPLLDLIWTRAYHQDTGLMDYRILKPGDTYVNQAFDSLHQLIIPGYAFYAKETGDIEARQRAVELFRTSGAYKPYVGKDFSQNYIKSFDSACDLWSVCLH